jgi:magnesium chelatase subunit D
LVRPLPTTSTARTGSPSSPDSASSLYKAQRRSSTHPPPTGSPSTPVMQRREDRAVVRVNQYIEDRGRTRPEIQRPESMLCRGDYLTRDNIVFPFSAVVGQEKVKRALLLNAVSHKVGGVLISGMRGTAKSTLARGLAHLLPEIEVVADCPFSCDPSDIESLCGFCAGHLAHEGTLPSSRTRMKMVTLPLNATEEMVVGTLDIERALRHGEKSFEPGMLARANRSILYVDEVNLLEDHLVDLLLDSAAMGVNVVEREGISFRHATQFILVGTMNPEEGDLRPQLEDRFGLCAPVDQDVTKEQRAEILRRTLEYSRNPLEFESEWHASQEELRRRLLAARERFGQVEFNDSMLELVAFIADRAGADGHRAEVAMVHSSRALAALEGCEEVMAHHVKDVSELAMNHRRGRGPLTEKAAPLDIDSLVTQFELHASGSLPLPMEVAAEGKSEDNESGQEKMSPPAGEPPEQGEDEDVSLRQTPSAETPGRRQSGVSGESRGRYYRSQPANSTGRPFSPSDIALDATIRASAARGTDRGKPEVQPEDLMLKVRKRKSGCSIVFVVDASASMGARKRLQASREAILSLLVEAYQKRDRVGLVMFKDEAAQLVMSPTSSTTLANRLLEQLSVGGTTPLTHGLVLARQVLQREMSRSPQPCPVLVLISDGGGNVAMGPGDPFQEAIETARDIRGQGIHSVVLDSGLVDSARESPAASSARKIADALGGRYFALPRISGDSILERVSRSAARSLGEHAQA